MCCCRTTGSFGTKSPCTGWPWSDKRLRTLRDLRGEHCGLLQRIYTQGCRQIRAETGRDPNQIMVYIHYPPSVYQLHVHFKYPVSPSHDAFRVHPVLNIINNLKINSDYYARSALHLPVYINSDLYNVVAGLKRIQTCSRNYILLSKAQNSHAWLTTNHSPPSSPTSSTMSLSSRQSTPGEIDEAPFSSATPASSA